MKKENITKGISVVVCTYNRSNLLRRAVQSLIEQTLARSLYEIVVVDNCSSDDTKEVITSLQQQHSGVNIELIKEANQGHNYVRNAGVREAKGKFIAFLDDDAYADKNWLTMILDCFGRIKPEPVVVGGVVKPFYLSPKLSWFKDKYEIRSWGEKERFLKEGESFSGSNMIFQKEIILKYDGFESYAGMRGNYMHLGDETGLFEKLWKGYGNKNFMFYSPKIIVYHAVFAYKMSVSYQLKRSFVAGQSHAIRQCKNKILRKIAFSLFASGYIFIYFLAGIARIYKYHLYKHWVVEELSKVLFGMGYLLGCLNIILQVRQRENDV